MFDQHTSARWAELGEVNKYTQFALCQGNGVNTDKAMTAGGREAPTRHTRCVATGECVLVRPRWRQCHFLTYLSMDMTTQLDRPSLCEVQDADCCRQSPPVTSTTNPTTGGATPTTIGNLSFSFSHPLVHTAGGATLTTRGSFHR